MTEPRRFCRLLPCLCWYPEVVTRSPLKHMSGYSERAGANVEIRLRKPTPEDYAYRLLDDGQRYDFILVDGACRIECLQTASKLLSERGIVVLHDAGRNIYHPGWKAFPHHELLYAGELPCAEWGYRTRGLAVFWQDKNTERAGWCRDWQ